MINPVLLKPRSDIDAALYLVVSLAEQNVIDPFDNPKEALRQKKAIKLVKETFGIIGD